MNKNLNYPKLLPFNDAEIVRSKNLERDEVQIEITTFLEENETLIDMDKRTYMTQLKESLGAHVNTDLDPTKITRVAYVTQFEQLNKKKPIKEEIKAEEPVKADKKEKKETKEKKDKKKKKDGKVKKENKKESTQDNGKKRKRTDPENSVDSTSEKPKK